MTMKIVVAGAVLSFALLDAVTGEVRWTEMEEDGATRSACDRSTLKRYKTPIG